MEEGGGGIMRSNRNLYKEYFTYNTSSKEKRCLQAVP